MAYRKRKPLHDWRAQLTPEEARAVARLDKAIEKADDARAAAVGKLNPIRNRAIQRCRYSASPPPAQSAQSQKEV